MHFAPLDGKVNIRSALIASDNRKSRAQSLFHELWYLIEMRARPWGATLGWLRGFTYIVDAFVRTIPAHNKNVIVLLRRADPIEFRPVELNLLSTDNLIHIYRRTCGAESQPVRFGDVVNI